MAIGPNEDGAELYREHLEGLVCRECGGCKEDRELHIFQLHEHLRAALTRAEKAEGALCSMKREFQHIAEYWNRSENDTAMNDALYHMIEVAESAALTLTAPCPHEEEAKRLREAVEWAMRTFGNIVLTERGRPVSTVSAELRRRAKEG